VLGDLATTETRDDPIAQLLVAVGYRRPMRYTEATARRNVRSGLARLLREAVPQLKGKIHRAVPCAPLWDVHSTAPLRGVDYAAVKLSGLWDDLTCEEAVAARIAVAAHNGFVLEGTEGYILPGMINIICNPRFQAGIAAPFMNWLSHPDGGVKGAKTLRTPKPTSSELDMIAKSPFRHTGYRTAVARCWPGPFNCPPRELPAFYTFTHTVWDCATGQTYTATRGTPKTVTSVLPTLEQAGRHALGLHAKPPSWEPTLIQRGLAYARLRGPSYVLEPTPRGWQTLLNHGKLEDLRPALVAATVGSR
jgi:hypothetical protein